MVTADCCPVRTCKVAVADFNPGAVAEILKLSGFRNGAVKRPSSLDLRFRVLLLAVSRTVTDALGTTAPLESTTMPLMLPVVALCAKAGRWHIRHSMSIVRSIRTGRQSW